MAGWQDFWLSGWGPPGASAPLFVCGAECGSIVAAAGHWDVKTGTGLTLETSTIEPAGGAYSYKWIANGAVANLAHTIAQTARAGRVYFNLSAFPSAAAQFTGFTNANGSAMVKCGTAGQILIRMGASAADVQIGTVATDGWHYVDFKADASGATSYIYARLDGGAEYSDSHAQTSVNFTAFKHGWFAGTPASGTIYIDQLVMAAYADYPIAAGYVAAGDTWVPAGGADFVGTGDVAIVTASAGTGAQTFAGAGAVARPVAIAGTAAETFAGSGAVAALSASAGIGIGAPGFIGTGAVTAAPSANAGTAAETFAGAGAVVSAAAVNAGTGLAGMIGSGAVARPSASSGTGAQTFSGAAAVARPSASAGAGAETFSGSGAVARGSASSGTGIGAPGFAGAGAVARSSANAGTGSETFAGTGAVTASMATSGTGTAQAPAITGTGSVAIAVALAGAGAELFTGSGALAFSAAIAGAGGLEFAGAGAIVAAIAAAGSGTVVVPPPIGLAAQMRIASVAVGMSMASAPGMSVASVSDAPTVKSARFIP